MRTQRLVVLMPASNDWIWRCTFSMACSTSKAVCPADGARALMKLKWNRYINQQERTTCIKKLKILHSFMGCPLLFQIVTDSIKTPSTGTVLSATARAKTPPLISVRRTEIKGGVLARPRACWKMHLHIRLFEAGIRLYPRTSISFHMHVLCHIELQHQRL